MIHIITPCSRPGNLSTIKQTIPEDCSWTVVVDEKATGDFPTGITYLRPNVSGSWGHPLRNVGMEFILALKAKRSDYIYFLDDDNIIHPDWYEAVKNEKSGNNLSTLPPELNHSNPPVGKISVNKP